MASSRRWWTSGEDQAGAAEEMMVSRGFYDDIGVRVREELQRDLVAHNMYHPRRRHQVPWRPATMRRAQAQEPLLSQKMGGMLADRVRSSIYILFCTCRFNTLFDLHAPSVH